MTVVDFKADLNIAKLCFKDYKIKAFLYTIGMGIFVTFEVLADYFKHHHIWFTIFYTLLGVSVLFAFLYMGFRGAVFMNASIMRIEETEETISFWTFSSSMFLSLIKRDQIHMTISRELTQFKLSDKKYGFSEKYTGEIYVLIVAGESYLIESNFFENFEELRHSLEVKD